jgi:nicotinate-nucleotide adenylyltransferase
MTSATRIGILGGTFDPVHLGHIDTALAAQRALALDQVLVMATGTPPHRTVQPSASRFHRFAMTALAVTGVSGLMVSDLEIGVTGPCYTYDTLARLHGTGLMASQIYFITGADAFAEIETWSRYPQVLEMAHFAVVSRPGHAATSLPSTLPALAERMQPAAPSATVVDTSAPATNRAGHMKICLIDARTHSVSSTDVRQRLERGLSISGLVPPAVDTYIEQHRLYSRGAPAETFGRSLA